ncbi:MAG TPA: RNA methyltransferase [Burkholderiales bacterium]|nr:RNA methyltransferase [Burkholderiales bacterium]
MKHIASRDNPFYKRLMRLSRASRAERRIERTALLEGVHLVRAYLDRFGSEGVELVVKESARGHPEIAGLVAEVPAVAMADRIFDTVSSVQTPVGVLAVAPIPKPSGMTREEGFQVFVDGVQDPGNLGSILRSAAAAGATMAHLSAECADPWSSKSLRGGMGAQFLLPIEEHADLGRAAEQASLRLVACTVSAETSVFDADLSGPVGFIIGGEGSGVTPRLDALARQRVRIPMSRGIDSLNAAAAAAVCFYEWVRRRGPALAGERNRTC